MNRCKVIAPRRFEDERGVFCETWNKKSLLAAGIDSEFVQDNLFKISRDRLGARSSLSGTAPRAGQAYPLRTRSVV